MVGFFSELCVHPLLWGHGVSPAGTRSGCYIQRYITHFTLACFIKVEYNGGVVKFITTRRHYKILGAHLVVVVKIFLTHQLFIVALFYYAP